MGRASTPRPSPPAPPPHPPPRRNGRAIETIGKYHPKAEPSLIEVDSERAQYWLGVGAQPTEPVQRLLEVTGDWQKFKDLPGAEGTLKVAEAKPDKLTLFNAALAEAGEEPTTEATTPKRRSSRKPKSEGAAEDGDRSEAKAESKSEAKAEAKAEGKPEGKPEAKAEGKPEGKPEAKAEGKAESEKA